MTSSRFDIAYENLPERIAIFPLPGAIVLPGQVLPLNIFEPRYLNMVLDALGESRMIGMVQPVAGLNVEPVQVHGIGCAGRLSAYQETGDGRLLINLTGVCRFKVGEELELRGGYRRVRPDWQAFEGDFAEPGVPSVGLPELEPALRAYFTAQRLELHWETLGKIEGAQLVDFLAMSLPFDPEVKQGLVEAQDVDIRGKLLLHALNEAIMDSSGTGTAH